MRDKIESLNGARFGCIMADPPWKFRSWVATQNPASSRSVERHYKTMPLAEINALPIRDVAAKDCHLFLWVVGPFLPRAIETMTAWGFRYSAIGFVWVKMRRQFGGRQHRMFFERDEDFHFGQGFTTRKNVEICLLGRRGSPRRLTKNVRELIVSPLREHSRKPDETYGRIERYAAGPYLELFSRTERPGWTCLGDEVGKFNGGQDAKGRYQHEGSQGAPTNGTGAERVSIP